MARVNSTSPKAIVLMEKNKSIKERASQYFDSIKREIQRTKIDDLVRQKEKLEDRIFDLEASINLETNLNAGKVTLSKEDLQKRFEEIMECEYQLKLIALELETKQITFTKYFGA